MPADLAEAVLLHEPLFEPVEQGLRGANADYDWAEIARRLILSNPEKRLLLAQKLLESIGNDTLVSSRFGHSYSHKLLTEIAKSLPREVWRIAVSFLGPPIDSRAYSIQSWVKGESSFFGNGNGDSFLNYVPLQDLWRWVDEDVEKRAWYLASFVPKDLFVATDRPCLVREVLARYGDRKDVRDNLAANFSTEGWMGPQSSHYASKKARLEGLILDEPEPRVRDWLREYISYLDRSIGRARMEEEREF